MEVFENLCETGPGAIYGFAKNQLEKPSLGVLDSAQMERYSAAMEVFENLNEMSGGVGIEFGARPPDAKERKNGAGNITTKHRDSAFLISEDTKFLKKLSEFFERIDKFSIYAYDDTDGDVVLTLDWGVENVYL